MAVIPPAKPTSVSVPRPVTYDMPNSFDRPGGQSNPQNKGIDIWGAIQRRKFLVLLLACIGWGIGYIQYTNTPKTFASSTKLMVSTQAPPELIDGNVRVAKNSNQKYANLIKSDVVLGNAVENGNFQQLKSFAGSGNPVGQLKGGMLRVVPDASEAIVIRVEGPVAEDLPIILAQVVKSFTELIEEDSQDVSQQTVALIESLASQLSNQKDGAHEEKEKIGRRLGMKVFDQSGRAINPYEQQVADLEEREKNLLAARWDVSSRIKSMTDALKVDDETGKPDPIQFKVLGLEAREYLNVNAFTQSVSAGSGQVATVQDNLRELEVRAREIQTRIDELRFDVSEKSQKFGSGHSSIISLNRRINFYTDQLREIQGEARQIEAANAQQTPGAAPLSPVELAKRSYQDQMVEWVSMYRVALARESKKLDSELSIVSNEMAEVENKMAMTASDISRLNVLQHQIDKKGEAVELIMDRLSEINVLANNYTMTKVRVLDEPGNGYKIAPSLPKLVGQAMFLAALLGVGLAVLIDLSELAFRSPHEIFERLQLPVVGKVPRIDTRKIKPTKGSPCLVTAHSPSSTASEAFRSIRTGLFFQSSANDLRTIMFTSPSAGDGKSTIIGNLAISIAQAGKTVILVDADFRRPRIDQYFGEDLVPGVLDVVTGRVDVMDAILESELQEGLSLLTTGGRPKNPGELVTSDVFRNLIETLRNQFDYVLIDAPPVLPVADPATIASFVDGVYLVTRIRKGVKLSAQKAKESLDRVGATWMGIIVNGLDENPHYSEYGYQYGSYSYYGGAYGKYYEANNKEYREKVS